MLGKRKYKFSETFYMLMVASKSLCVENKRLCEVNANNPYVIITSQSRKTLLNFYYRERFQNIFIISFRNTKEFIRCCLKYIIKMLYLHHCSKNVTFKKYFFINFKCFEARCWKNKYLISYWNNYNYLNKNDRYCLFLDK